MLALRERNDREWRVVTLNALAREARLCVLRRHCGHASRSLVRWISNEKTCGPSQGRKVKTELRTDFLRRFSERAAGVAARGCWRKNAEVGGTAAGHTVHALRRAREEAGHVARDGGTDCRTP